MTPTPLTAALLVLVSLAALAVPGPVAALGAVALAGAAVADAAWVRKRPEVERTMPDVLSRGIAAPLSIVARPSRASEVRLRQARVPDVDIETPEGAGSLSTRIMARRRGRHVLPPVGVRSLGPLGLGAWHHKVCGDREILVYPDLVTARNLADAVRRGRFRGPGRITRGPLGLGTEFESIREYLPDDDIRQVNWLATARVGRPMSNQYRVEQDREIVCVVDTGRLMAAPLGDRTRLDAAIDAATAVCLVADELGDRSGAIAFDASIRRRLSPRRDGAKAVVRTLFDLEPTTIDSDYELAFRAVGGAKRAFVLVFTDLLEESAARPLIEAAPYLSRRHAVVVASARDADLDSIVRTTPSSARDAYAAAVAVEVLAARERVAALLRRAGAEVLEAPARQLAAACVDAYLRAKRRARL